MNIKGIAAAQRMARRDRRRDDIEGHIREIALRPARYGPPRRVRSDVSVSVRQRRGWPVYTVEPTAADPLATVLYLHGGAWVHQIAKPHWRLIELVAARTGTRVVVPLYPLIPFGTAADVLPVVVDIATETAADTLIGDSAGGQIALSAALALRDEQRTTSTVLISPALDIALRNPAIDSIDDPLIDRASLREYGRWWQNDLSDDDSRVSPLCADLAGLGPMTVFSGTRDILNPDARALVAKAVSSGVPVDYHEGRRLTHVYPLFPTSAGRRAQKAIVETLRRQERAALESR
jgi:acetyl esterase/lipase